MNNLLAVDFLFLSNIFAEKFYCHFFMDEIFLSGAHAVRKLIKSSESHIKARAGNLYELFGFFGFEKLLFLVMESISFLFKKEHLFQL